MEPARDRNPKAVQRGLSLAELLVLVAALGLLGAAVLLTSGWAERPLDTAVLRVQELVERARDLSAERQRPHVVVFDVERNRAGIVDRHGASVVDPLTRVPWLLVFGDSPLSGVDLESADFGLLGASLAFDARGQSLAPGEIVLRLRERRIALVLDEESGVLRVAEPSANEAIFARP